MSEFDTVTAPPPPPSSGSPTAEEKQWAMFAHLSALLGCVITSFWMFGAGAFIGPLVIWLVKKDTLPFVNEQAKEALNFSITYSIIAAIMLLLTIVTLGIGVLIAAPIMFIVGIGWLVFTIIAAVKSNNGESYRYPVSLRLIK